MNELVNLFVVGLVSHSNMENVGYLGKLHQSENCIQRGIGFTVGARWINASDS